jgi:hypothetical protein
MAFKIIIESNVIVIYFKSNSNFKSNINFRSTYIKGWSLTLLYILELAIFYTTRKFDKNTTQNYKV